MIMLNKIEGIIDSSPSRYDTLRPLTSGSIVLPYSLTFLSIALIKAWVGLGYFFSVTSGFSLHEPREKHPLKCLRQNKTTNL
jgi:hypothetical protein